MSDTEECVARRAATSSAHVTTIRWAGGKPAGTAKRASSSATVGASSNGFRTTGAPTAIAGPTLCATRLSGKLTGEIATTTPTGRQSVHAIDPAPFSAASVGIVLPVMLRATAALKAMVETVRSTSSRATLIGSAASRQIT